MKAIIANIAMGVVLGAIIFGITSCHVWACKQLHPSASTFACLVAK